MMTETIAAHLSEAGATLTQAARHLIETEDFRTASAKIRDALHDLLALETATVCLAEGDILLARRIMRQIEGPEQGGTK